MTGSKGFTIHVFRLHESFSAYTTSMRVVRMHGPQQKESFSICIMHKKRGQPPLIIIFLIQSSHLSFDCCEEESRKDHDAGNIVALVRALWRCT